MKSFLIGFVLVASILGCSTPYKKGGFMGGYEDCKIQDGVFLVSFRGNGYTSYTKAKNYALLRAAEVTKENGYKHFIILDETRDESIQTVVTPKSSYTTGYVGPYGNYSSTTNSYGGYVDSYSRPRSSFTIKCFNDEEKDNYKNAVVYDANQVDINLKEAHQIK
jgi:hypothetical protein